MKRRQISPLTISIPFWGSREKSRVSGTRKARRSLACSPSGLLRSPLEKESFLAGLWEFAGGTKENFSNQENKTAKLGSC